MPTGHLKRCRMTRPRLVWLRRFMLSIQTTAISNFPSLALLRCWTMARRSLLRGRVKHRYLIADAAQKEKVIQLYTELISAKPVPKVFNARGRGGRGASGFGAFGASGGRGV